MSIDADGSIFGEQLNCEISDYVPGTLLYPGGPLSRDGNGQWLAFPFDDPCVDNRG